MDFIGDLTSRELAAFVLEITLKGTLVLAAAGLVAAALRKASAATRHLVWSTALVLVLLLPAFVAFAPSYDVAVIPAALVINDDAVRDDLNRPVSIEALSVPLSRRAERAARRLQRQRSDLATSTEATVPVPMRLERPQRVSDTQLATATPFDWRQALFLLWVIGAGLVAVRYALGWVALRRLRRGSIPVADVGFRLFAKRVAGELGLRRRIRLLWAKKGTMPLTFGCIRPTVILPEDAADWPADRLLVVLQHELAHIKRWDCLVQAVVYFACTIYWFNPLVWVAAANSHREREMACDDYVLATGSKGSDYASHLLEIARSLNGPRFSGVTTIAMARRSELEGRLLSILSPNKKRGKATTQNVLGTFAVLSCVVLTVAAVRPVAMKAADSTRTSEPTPQASRNPRVAPEARPTDGVTVRANVSARADLRASASVNLDVSDFEDKYLAEASAIVERAAESLESSLNKLVPKKIRLNGALLAELEGVGDLDLAGRLEIVGSDTIPIEQIRRLRNAGVDVEYIEELAAAGFDHLTIDQLVSLAHAGVDAEDVRSFRALGYEYLTPDDMVQLGFAGVEADDVRMWAEMGYKDLSVRDLIKLGHAGLSPEYVRSLAEIGYGNLSANELIQFGHADVEPEFIRALKDLGLNDLSPNELIRLSHADVDAEFVRAMREAGYPDLDASDLIQLSHADVDPAFIRRLAEIGLTDLSTDDLVRLGHADVDVEFIAEMKKAGYSKLTASELVSLSHADVDARFVREIREMGLTDLSVTDLVKLGHADIDAEFIKEMQRSGYDNLSVDDWIQLGYAGVDPEYIAELGKAGLTGLSLNDLVQLGHAGIDSDVVRDLSRAGLGNLGASDLIQLGFADVDSDYIHDLSQLGLTNLSVNEVVMLAHSGVDADDIKEMQKMGLDTTDPEKVVRYKFMDLDPEYVQSIRKALEN